MKSDEKTELKLFNVSDLRTFFIHGNKVPYLSERVIARSRAFATIMNPYVTNDMVVISSVFVDGEVVAYTYVIPDLLMMYSNNINDYVKKLIYWNTVLFVDKKYEGRGFGAIVIGQMVELYGDSYFDLDAAPASIANLQYAGLRIDYIKQFSLEQKRINVYSLKGKLSYTFNKIIKKLNPNISRLVRLIDKTEYSLVYQNYIDDISYEFIKQHCNNDLFLRSQSMLNWILSYPCAQYAPLMDRVDTGCYFATETEDFNNVFMQILFSNRLIGVCMYHRTRDLIYFDYLYYNETEQITCFIAIAEHLLKFTPNSLVTSDRSLYEYLKSLCIFSHHKIFNKSFSHPRSFNFDNRKFIHAGDGDNFI